MVGISVEDKYIRKRKIKALIHSLAFYICRVFPVKNNKVVMWTFEGSRGFCCNPKYIAEELLKKNSDLKSNYEIVWLVNNISDSFPNGIKKVKNTLWNRAYHLSTAKFWIANTRTFYGTKKRKKQIYIQTWHGTLCIKPIGKYRGDLFPKIAHIISEYDSKMVDYVLSGSGWCDKHYRDGLVYDGEIIRTGTPRCDVLVKSRDEMRALIREKYQVPVNSNILLYAPTFRGGSQTTNRNVSVEESRLAIDGLIESLEKRFGGDWYIFLRLHPQLAAKDEIYKSNSKSENVIDVTQYQDMNELIAGADGFITDYSSAIFEAMLLKMPCFIYADDMEEYIRDRGDLFFDKSELPFSVANNNEELIRNIIEFDDKQYIENVEKFIKEQDIVEDGNASKRVAELVQGLEMKKIY